MSDIFAWAIHYDDGKKHPRQPNGINTGIVVMGISQGSCLVTLAQFEDEIDMTRCTFGCVYKDEFMKGLHQCEIENNSNETD